MVTTCSPHYRAAVPVSLVSVLRMPGRQGGLVCSSSSLAAARLPATALAGRSAAPLQRKAAFLQQQTLTAGWWARLQPAWPLLSTAVSSIFVNYYQSIYMVTR